MFLKLNHWTNYTNFLMLISPPFFAFYLSRMSTEPKEYMVIFGLLYYVAIIVMMTNKVTGLLDEVKQLKRDLKQCKGEPLDETPREDTDKKDKDSDPA